MASAGVHAQAVALTLAATAEAPTLARRAAARALAHWRAERRDGALLVVSELVTNAVRHGSVDADDDVRLLVRRRAGTTRIEVSDRRRRDDDVAGGPTVRADRGQRSGWGLPIVAELADRWGFERGPRRTCVWCEIDDA